MPYSADIIRAAEDTRNTTVYRDPDKGADSPDYESASYRSQMPQLEIIRAVYGGTETMREEKEKFLPQHPMEADQQYKKRRSIALAYNALKRTVGGLNGMIFRRDPVKSEDMPEEIQVDLENVDQQGRALPVFLRHVAENALVDGHTWLHVEAPRIDSQETRTAQDAIESGFRPYWINIPKKQAHNWRYEMRNGKPVLTLFAYSEGSVEPDGEFGERAVDRIRVLVEGRVDEDGNRGNVRGELWEKQEVEKKQKWALVETYEIGVSEIPVVCVYAERTGVFESQPPLMDLAYEQIEHFRVRSDRQRSMTFSSIAVPYCFGEKVTDEEGNASVKWGPDGMMLVNDPETKAGIIESQGYGLEATKEELQEIQARMASLGLQMLVRETRAAETAQAKVLDKTESDAALAVFAISLEDAANQALEYHAEYRTIDQAGTVTLNRDFHDQLIDAALLRELRELVESGLLPIDELWTMLQKGEVLDAEFNFEEARAKLEAEREARLQAVERQIFGGDVDDAA